jgi:hypothetical protein
MYSFSARWDTKWVSFTPLHEHTLTSAREIAIGSSGPFAGAIVGVYGSGKSTLAFTLLQESMEAGQWSIWDEAAPFIDRLVPEGTKVLPQEFAARVRAWVQAITSNSEEQEHYRQDLIRRGHQEIADRLLSRELGERAPHVLLVLDEVEQAHHLLTQRIATDDGQPLRALIDVCNAQFRLLLAYAPESFHSVGDADRGRLAYLPVPALSPTAIRKSFDLTRGEANFAWWASRGRARGVIQAVHTVLQPARHGAFAQGLNDLTDAIDALPGVFGVPAILRDHLRSSDLRSLLDLRPTKKRADETGVCCDLGDRFGLAERMTETMVRSGTDRSAAEPVANELVCILEAVSDDQDQAFLTLEEVKTALKLAEARAVESGRLREPLPGFVDRVVLGVITTLGNIGQLEQSLTLSLTQLAEEIFPSPFTDPVLPLPDGHMPKEADIEREFAERFTGAGPVLSSDSRRFLVFANPGVLAAWLEGGQSEMQGVRAIVLTDGNQRPPLLQLAELAGRVSIRDIGRFHGVFLKCLAILCYHHRIPGQLDELELVLSGDRQIVRKVHWHLNRIEVQLRDASPTPSSQWTAAAKAIRELFRSGAGRLDRTSPGLMAFLLPFRPPMPQQRRVLENLAALFADKGPIRRMAQEASPGARLQGAAVVVDELLPVRRSKERRLDRLFAGKDDLAAVLGQFGTDGTLRSRLATWLHPEAFERVETWLRFYAGELPDVSEEQEQVDALQNLEDTARRATAISEDIHACIGARHSSLDTLRLGLFTDQVRAATSSLADLRKLGQTVRALEPGWPRSLALWICGVFADRILRGVETEQASLSDWEATASEARELGQRADAVESRLKGLGANQCMHVLHQRRLELPSWLNSREEFRRELERLRAGVAAYDLIAAALVEARETFSAREVTIDRMVAQYLPDEDTVLQDRDALRGISEVLAELNDPLPSPMQRSLSEYLAFLRQLSTASRAQRLRIRLQDCLGVTLPDQLRVDSEEVEAIEQAWATTPDDLKVQLLDQMVATSPQGSDEIERWVTDVATKEEELSQWSATSTPLLDPVDERVRIWARSIATTPDQVREAGRRRAECLDSLSSLAPDFVAPSVKQALVTTHQDTASERTYVRVAEAARLLAAELVELRDRLRSILGEPPARPTGGHTLEEARTAWQEAISHAEAERDKVVEQVHDFGRLLERLGKSPASIPPGITLTTARRLREQEEARLRSVLGEEASTQASRFEQLGLPHPALVATEGDLANQVANILHLRDALTNAEHAVGCLMEIAMTRELPRAPDIDALVRHLEQAIEQAREEQRQLAERYAMLEGRARRLGGDPIPHIVGDLPLPAARKCVDALAGEIEKLRETRLHDASMSAREAYTAILPGGNTALLPKKIQELVVLGLLRTIEDPL